MRPAALYLLFFFSGLPALIYQLIWQRALFSAFGVNIESITIVVTIFILGLGLGGLSGGYLSRWLFRHLLALFAVLEIAAGIYGYFSLDMISLITAIAMGASLAEICMWSVLILLPPTMLMGASLPVLVQFLVQRSGNVGRSFGGLYAANTLGAAVACFAGASFLFSSFGQQGSISLAALLNLLIGSGAVLALLVESFVLSADETDRTVIKPSVNTSPVLSVPVALVAVTVTGFVSLSWEIVWIRAYHFASSGTSSSVVLLLGFYLLGLALGSLISVRLSRPGGNTGASRGGLVTILAGTIVATSLVAFAVVPVTALAVASVDYWWTLPLVSLSTVLFGCLLPLIAHLSTSPGRETGLRTGVLYLFNVIGGAAGSFLTGFMLFEILSLREVAVVLTLAGLISAAIVLIPGKHRKLSSLALSGVAVAVLLITPLTYGSHFERLQKKAGYRTGYVFQQLVENRSGVIAVTPSGRVFGGGAYDGVYSTDPVNDRNGIFRAYAVGLVHPAPTDVLMIGLASGSWAQVVANNPAVKRLTIVEINPGYVDLVRKQPAVASLLQNSKVTIIADDGKRWMGRHDNETFDLVVMNTIHHWRAHSTHLLSQEFMALARSRLKPGGVLYYNSTRSLRAMKTGAGSFPFALGVAGIVAVSDKPFQPDKTAWRALLTDYKIDGKPVFDLKNRQDARRFRDLASLPDSLMSDNPGKYEMARRDVILKRAGRLHVITEDNMGQEWSRY
jgi:spermidine synthase